MNLHSGFASILFLLLALETPSLPVRTAGLAGSLDAAGSAPSWTAVATPQTPEDAAIRALVQSFFTSFENKDLGAMMALWSEKSTDLAASKHAFERLVAGVGQIQLRSLLVDRIEVNGDRATLRVVVEMTALDLKTDKPAAGFGRLNRTLDLIKEGNTWKAFRYASSEQILAARIAAADSDVERKRLSASSKDLLTVELYEALLGEADRLAKQSLQSQAIAVLRCALDIASRLDDKPAMASVFQRIGSLYFSQGSYDPALEYYQKGLSLSESIGDKAVIAAALDRVGRAQSGRGNFVASIDYYQNALKLFVELGDESGAATIMNNMGIAQRGQGNFEQALRCYHDSLKITEKLGDKSRVAITLGNIGLVHCDQGYWVRALEYLGQCLRMEREVGDVRMTANALNTTGLVWWHQGDYKRALGYFEQVLKIAEQIGSKAMIAGVLINIGGIYDSQGNGEHALEVYQRSLKMQEDVGAKQEIAADLTNIGEVYLNQKNTALALDYFARALKIEEDIGEKDRQGRTSNSIAEAYNSLGEYSKAAVMADRSAAIARQIGDPEALSKALITAGKAHQAMGQLDMARQAFDGAINAVEHLRSEIAGSATDRQRFMENSIAPYYAMVDLLIDQSNQADALAFAERAKARVLIEILQSGKADMSKAMTSDEKDGELKIKSQLASLNAQIIKEKVRNEPDQARLSDLSAQLEHTRLQFDAFQSDLYAAHPELRTRRASFQPITPGECAALLPTPNAALLEFFVSQERTTLFVLTKKNAAQQNSDLRVYKIAIKQKDLAGLCQQFRERLSNGGLGYAEPARKLYDLLLGAAAQQLAGKSAIIIVPDGPLWELPFQALQQPGGRFLIQDHAVSLAPSLTALREMSRPKHGGDGDPAPSTMLLAFGNPKLADDTRSSLSQAMDADLSPLPAAADMVKDLAALYGPARSKVYVEASATEDTFKAEAPTCRILHIAAHGIVDNSSPMYSQIILSRGAASDDDGVLEAWEVMNLDLKSDLVVLSACETARGRVSAGEGMIGLSWAFFVAGCPTTVASQWKVEAPATTPLMVEFHRSLLSNIGKAEALRRAELKLLRTRRYAHPFYWAGFVMIGNGN